MTKIKEVTIELENHEQQLIKAWELLNKVIKDYKWFRDIAKNKAKSIILDRPVTDEDIRKYIDIPNHKRKFLVYMVDNILSAAGDMSITRFEAMIELEEEYKMKYLQSPALGKTLFVEHYEKLHAPYDKLKNKCFDLLFKLDPKASIVDTIE